VASHTIGGQTWPSGTTVSVYSANALPASGDGTPVGVAVTSAVVSGSSVTFDGLSENVRYLAYAAGVGKRFLVPQVDPMDARSLRARVDELEGDRVPAVEGSIEVSLRSYASGSKLTGGSSVITELNQAISDVSAAALSVGAQGRLIVPKSAVLGIDSNIIAKSNVTVELGTARIVGLSDVASAGMFRAVPSAQQAAVGVGAATTANGSYLLTSVASPSLYYPEMVVSGAGIQSGSKVVSVSVVDSVVALDKPATASATIAVTRAATYYGYCDNFRVVGGELDPNAKHFGGVFSHIFAMHFLNGFRCEGTRILHNLPSASPGYAFNVGGRNGVIEDVSVVGGQWEFSDGIHIVHGQNWRVAECHVESGDDMLALGRDDGTSWLDTEPDPVRHITVDGLTGRSNMAFAVKGFIRAGQTTRDFEITDVTISNVNASPAQTDNGAIRLADDNATAAGTAQMKRWRFTNLALQAGSNGHRDNNLHQLIHCASVDDVSFLNVAATMTDKASPTNGFDVVRIEKSRDVTVDKLTVNGLPKRYGFYATDSIRPKLLNSALIGGAAAGGEPVRLASCTDFAIVGNHFEPSQAGQSAVRVNEGSGSYGKIRGNTVRRGDTNCFLVLHTAASVTYLDVDDNDTQGSTRTFSSLTEWATTGRAPFPASPPRRIHTGRNRFDATGAGATTLSDNGAGAFAGTVPAYAAVYIDPAEFVAGARSVKLRMELMCLVNNVAPGVDISVALVAISAPAGAAGTVSLTQGSTVSGSTVTATTPGANSSTRAKADFTLPAAGWYATVAIIGGAGMAGSSSAFVRANLYVIEGI
jgi:hypothetical protein